MHMISADTQIYKQTEKMQSNLRTSWLCVKHVAGKRPRLSDYHDDQEDDGAELQDEGSETERLDKVAR